MHEPLSDPRGALDAAYELTRKGQFVEALERHLWFHDHALESMPALAGVRLSFALSHWAQLGRQYPPARDAMSAVRDRTVAAVRAGDTSFQPFHDLVALNEHLCDEAATGAAFLNLRARDPKSAARYYARAERGLVACEAYAVCAAYIPDAVARFVQIRVDRRSMMGMSPSREPEHVAVFYEVVERRFAEDIGRLVQILMAVGRQEEAERVRASARSETESAAAREAIAHAGLRLGGTEEPGPDGPAEPGAAPDTAG